MTGQLEVPTKDRIFGYVGIAKMEAHPEWAAYAGATSAHGKRMAKEEVRALIRKVCGMPDCWVDFVRYPNKDGTKLQIWWGPPKTRRQANDVSDKF